MVIIDDMPPEKEPELQKRRQVVFKITIHSHGQKHETTHKIIVETLPHPKYSEQQQRRLVTNETASKIIAKNRDGIIVPKNRTKRKSSVEVLKRYEITNEPPNNTGEREVSH